MPTKLFLKSLIPAATVAYSFVITSPVYGAIKAIDDGIDSSKPDGASTTLIGTDSIFIAIANTLIYIVGAVSVIMLIIGGFRYVISSGNSSSVSGAKDTILYAIIGLIVASMAFAIARFVAAHV